jgi:hypothetical protein
VEITARVLSYEGAELPMTLTPRGTHAADKSWRIPLWPSGKTQTLEGDLTIPSSSVDGEFLIELTFRCDQAPTRLQKIQAEISVPVMPRDPKGKVFPVQGPLPLKVIPQTIRSVDDPSTRDYLLTQSQGNSWQMAVLKENNGSYSSSPVTEVQVTNGVLVDVLRLDADFDGRPDYAAVFQEKIPPSGPVDKNTPPPLPVWEFKFFDSNFQPSRLSSLTYDSKTAWISERYTWMKLRDRLVPAWISIGYTPDLEKPKYDPWDPNPTPERGPHLYYVDTDGLRSVPAPDDYFFLETLSPTATQRRAGLVPVLLAKGEADILEYATAVVSDGKVTDVKPFTLAPFRRLTGLTALNVLSLDGKENDLTLLAGLTTTTGQGLTWLSDQGAKSEGVTSPLDYDPIRRIAGAFVGEGKRAVFGQSLYDLHFYDLAAGQWVTTPLKRFSFLPGFVFDRTFYPVVVSGGRPGLLVPGGLVNSYAMEVVVPVYENGRLTRLARPAEFRLEAGDDCQELEFFPADGDTSAAVFFCGDHFLRVPF